MYGTPYTDPRYWPMGSNAQISGFAGATTVRSFGSEYDTGLVGGSASVGFRIPDYWRVQADVAGETTGDYSAAAGNANYVALGAHINWNIVTNIDFGVFGGVVRVDPTFSQPSSFYDYVGGEARYFTSSWMVGIQAGYLDLAGGSGAGILSDAGFVEGRARVLLGNWMSTPVWKDFAVGGSFGWARGSIGTTSVKAESTYWSATLDYKFAPNLTGFGTYQGFENRTSVFGTVWDEHSFKIGLKLDLGNPRDAVPVEPVVPQPTSLFRLMTKF
jgi:hypothetical protein